MKVLVSACLTGCNCKYNGGNNYNQRVADYLKDKEVIEICPEMLAGLGAPRSPAEIADGVVITRDGKNPDKEFREGVTRALETIRGEDIGLIILQSRSPTCGVNRIYDGSFSGKLIPGQGLFADALIKLGYKVIDAEDIK
jgi:uncharacterized protein YbbK (DUF523 family)